MINPNLVINQQFGESRGSARVDTLDSSEVDLPRETKTSDKSPYPSAPCCRILYSCYIPWSILSHCFVYTHRFAVEIGPRLRGNPSVPEFAKTLGTSLEDQTLFRPIMTLLIATCRSFCAYKTSPKKFRHRYWYLLAASTTLITSGYWLLRYMYALLK